MISKLAQTQHKRDLFDVLYITNYFKYRRSLKPLREVAVVAWQGSFLAFFFGCRNIQNTNKLKHLNNHEHGKDTC